MCSMKPSLSSAERRRLLALEKLDNVISIPTKLQQRSPALRARLAQLRKLSVRNMANRTISAVAGNRDRLSELRQPLASLVNLVGAGVNRRQALPLWH